MESLQNVVGASSFALCAFNRRFGRREESCSRRHRYACRRKRRLFGAVSAAQCPGTLTHSGAGMMPLSASKDALFTFQKAGDHEGGNQFSSGAGPGPFGRRKNQRRSGAFRHIRPASGSQVNASWGVLRAVAMENGGPVSFRESFACSPKLPRIQNLFTERGAPRDLWLLLTLVEVRIQWELGRYAEGTAAAEEGRRLAHFYGLEDEECVMGLWKGRCMLSSGNLEGLRLLNEAADSNERSRPGGRGLRRRGGMDGRRSGGGPEASCRCSSAKKTQPPPSGRGRRLVGRIFSD